MRRFLGAVFAIGCVLILIRMCAGVSTPTDLSGGTERAASAGSTPAVSISAGQLHAEYQSNEVLADSKYKGAILEVSGIVASINKDLFDHAYLELATSNEFEGVQAHLEDSEQAAASRLMRGAIVTVRCRGGGMVVGSPMLEHCLLVPAAAQPSPSGGGESVMPAQSTTAPDDTQSTSPEPSPSAAAPPNSATPVETGQTSAEDPLAKVEIGMTKDQVVSALGPPTAATIGQKSIFSYPTGKIVFVDDQVSQIIR